MNDAAKPRYHSPLRSRQKEQTRELILDAVGRILQGANVTQVTIADVARAAEITERTIYRHFPTREDLLEACWRRALRTALRGDTSEVETLDKMLALTREAFRIFDQHEGIVRALIESPEGREVRKRPGQQRLQALERAFGKILADVPGDLVKTVALATHAIASTPVWAHLRDQCGLDGEQAGDLVTLAIKLMVEGAKRRAKASVRA